MRILMRVVCILGIAVLPVFGAPKENSAAKSGDTIVIVFKDGHQQSFSMADIARIEFNTPSSVASTSVGINRFLGRWTVGEGGGTNENFTITLERGGIAHKSIGSTRGTWVVVDGEAHISWGDGWHDVIRRVGDKYEKVAHAPGTSISDPSDNITDARRDDQEPL
jgi:hypothetical protein